MSDEDGSSYSAHQGRLNRIVAGYLERAEAGRAPDREEILAKTRSWPTNWNSSSPTTTE